MITFFIIVFIIIATLSFWMNHYATVYTDGVPNLSLVSPGVWRSGQPATLASWQYLKSMGINTVIKLNFESEGSDGMASSLGIKVINLSIPPENDLASVFERPDPIKVYQAVDIMKTGGGVLVHCSHGHDRTGLVVGTYRVKHDNFTKEQAWNEMIAHDFHPELVGLVGFWEENVK